MSNVIELPAHGKGVVPDTKTKILGCDLALTLADDMVAVEVEDETAESLVKDFLPPTNAVYGPPKNPRRYRLYRSTSPEVGRKFTSQEGKFVSSDGKFVFLRLRAAPEAVPLPPDCVGEPAPTQGLKLMTALQLAATRLELRIAWPKGGGNDGHERSLTLVRAIATELHHYGGDSMGVRRAILGAFPEDKDPGKLKLYASVIDHANLLGYPRGFYWPVVAHSMGEDVVKAIRAIWGDSGDLAAVPASYTDLVLSAPELQAMQLPPREHFVRPFLMQGSWNVLCAPYGVGKTWFCLELVRALCKPCPFFAWEVPKARRVLYIDGEMPLSDLKHRIARLHEKAWPGFTLLASQRVHDERRPPLNLNTVQSQAAVQEVIDDVRPEVVIIDNLSSLCPGRDENDNSALDGLLRWLIGLRHQGLAVLVVHHTGKDLSKGARGASRLLDQPDYEIMLDPIDDPKGAAFMIKFRKTRDEKPDPYSLDVRLVDGGDMLKWDYAQLPTDEEKASKHKFAILDYVKGGGKDFGELGKLLKVSPSQTSKVLSKLKEKGYLEKGEGVTALTPMGQKEVSFEDQM